jgi:hypothetical protein
MKTDSYHISAFGSFAPNAERDSQGYVTYHCSGRYAAATIEQLDDWCASRLVAVRNAAETEKASRALAEWRES